MECIQFSDDHFAASELTNGLCNGERSNKQFRRARHSLALPRRFVLLKVFIEPFDLSQSDQDVGAGRRQRSQQKATSLTVYNADTHNLPGIIYVSSFRQ